MEWASALLLTCAVLCGELLRRAWAYERRTAAFRDQVKTELLRVREARRQAENLRQLEQAQALAETVIGSGTATVRAVHKGIANIPFGILEAIPSTSLSAKAARKTHDAIADAIYGGIHGANRLFGEATRRKIRPPEPDDEPPSKKS
jgi:hypothetical protein